MDIEHVETTFEKQLGNLVSIGTDLTKDRNYELAWQRIGRWRETTSNMISQLVSKEEGEKLRSDEHYPGWTFDEPRSEVDWVINRYSSHVRALMEDLKLNPQFFIGEVSSLNKETAGQKSLVLLENIFLKFHAIAHRLRSRHKDRPTLEIEDEYDVQDLLGALLALHFDDIRPEDPSSISAGASSRIDFVLKELDVVIEVKKTHKGLADKTIGDQLILDIKRYRTHPNCKTLVCFIYDPEGRIKNRSGLINDLEEKGETMSVRVFIEPKI